MESLFFVVGVDWGFFYCLVYVFGWLLLDVVLNCLGFSWEEVVSWMYIFLFYY